MRSPLRRVLVIGLLLAGGWGMPGSWAPPAHAQSHLLVPTGDPAYHLIERLQRRGHLLGLNPTALPYRAGEVRAALAALDASALDLRERRWVRLLDGLLPPEVSAPSQRPVVGGTFAFGARTATNDRLDPLRYTDAVDPGLTAGDLRIFPNASPGAMLEHGPVVARFGFRHDYYLDVDPDGLDAVRRLYIRPEDAYLGLSTRYASAYLGTFGTHWGPAGQPALILSQNPVAYDRLQLRVGGERLSLRSVLGELDSATDSGQFIGIGTARPGQVGARRRYLTAHRFDWRPSRRLVLSLQESVLYSGRGAGLSLKYANPLLPFAFTSDTPPKNDENNALLGGLLWAQAGRWTLSGQLLIDDFDVDLVGERTSFALAGRLLRAGGVDVGLAGEAVAARTYNTHQPEGRYLYLLRGLGTEFNDYVQLEAFVDAYPGPALTLTPYVAVLLQGERIINEPYPTAETDSDIATILDGTVERTLRLAVRTFYQRHPSWWLRADVGFNQTDNLDHVEGLSETRAVVLVSAHVRLRAFRAFDLDF